MTKMHVTYRGSLRTEATHLDSGATLITDAPKDNQGEGQSFSPTDLLATSLASCMLTIMGIKARSLALSIDGTTCEVEKIMQAAPRKVAEIKVRVRLQGSPLTAEQQDQLTRAALACPVFLSLDPALTKTIEWERA
ncbi:MAG: OsmC family protein [Bacteriovoracia bacterium]